jgi:hypothetical protein
MIKDIYTEADLIEFINNDRSSGRICDESIKDLFLNFDQVKDMKIATYENDLKAASSGVHYKYYLTDEYILRFNINEENHIKSKHFYWKDNGAAYRKSELPYLIEYDEKKWIRKKYNAAYKRAKPTEIIRSMHSVAMTYTPVNYDKMYVNNIILSDFSNYIQNIDFYRGYTKITSLNALILDYPELNNLRFNVKNIEKLSMNNKRFKEALKIIEMICI